MEIQQVISLFEHSLSSAKNESEIRANRKTCNLLQELSERNFKLEEKQLLEAELDSLFANETIGSLSGKVLKKKREHLVAFLNEKLFLVVEGSYTGFGGLIGFLAGMIVSGALIPYSNTYFIYYIPLMSMIGGMAIGAMMEAQVKRLGRVLKVSF